MKFKIIFGVVMATAFISVYTIINAIAGGISDNQAGLNRLNQSFLSLNEEFDSLKELDEQLNAEAVVEPETVEPEPVEDLGVNAGLGVLTGTQITGQPEITSEPETITEPIILAVCPKVSSPKPYGDYIQRINIKRNLKFTVIYDLFEGNVINVQYDGRVPSNVKTATFNYVMDLTFDKPTTINGCTLPFTINI